MLELDEIDTYYGASHILQGLSLTVGAGEAVALLGRNGAGKTTTMRTVIGLTPARRGRVVLAGQHVEVALTRVLRQVADVTDGVHRAGVGLALAGQDAHRGGLARAVAAHQADPVTGLDPQRGALDGQQCARPGADLQVRCGDHATTSSC